MRGQYYYIIASLPHLSLHEPPPLNVEDFLSLCKRHLKRSAFETLRSIKQEFSLLDRLPLKAAKRWYEWEGGIRDALARLRAEKLGISAGEYRRGYIPESIQSDIAREAFNADSPLKAEEILNKARWRFLEELEFGNYFNLESLAIYYLKLQILERVSHFDEERGRERLDSILKAGETSGDIFLE